MSTLEFLSRRRTNSLKEGDYVYYEHVTGWNGYGLPETEIILGRVLGVDVFGVDVEPVGKETDDFICHTVQIKDCRKITKAEQKQMGLC